MLLPIRSCLRHTNCLSIAPTRKRIWIIYLLYIPEKFILKPEYFISWFDNQSFANQDEHTGEARAFTKLNGDPSNASGLDMSKTLAELSVDGVPEWNIQPMSLSVTFGRYGVYGNDISKTFQTMNQSKGQKNKCIHVCTIVLLTHSRESKKL